ncbi:hypothetical protein OAN307_c18110 [Octadecabacter antarcticus 307]|uniref:Uncharacterized protein n=1 Tax=Octadecabacter antarcticus 307 TaxID=391626 RepID=M9R4F1_9RHOB|nr:hypothetical protein [Octadecabacter antarcticus]AGI67469.1 hypothetical protein OAN307_c18110 [Octadecabacter antarcticus 307]
MNTHEKSQEQLFETNLELSKPLGDYGDQIIEHDVAVYLATPNGKEPKIGTTFNPAARKRAQSLKDDEFEVLWWIVGGYMTSNHIHRTEQIEARKFGLKDEHEGHRHAVNRARLGTFGQSGTYDIKNIVTGEIIVVSDAGALERKHKLVPKSLSRAANPKQNHKHVKINGVKHTVSYAENKKGGE